MLETGGAKASASQQQQRLATAQSPEPCSVPVFCAQIRKAAADIVKDEADGVVVGVRSKGKGRKKKPKAVKVSSRRKPVRLSRCMEALSPSPAYCRPSQPRCAGGRHPGCRRVGRGGGLSYRARLCVVCECVAWVCAAF